jgi:acetylglutamate kinase
LESAGNKIQNILEALPYLIRFSGKTIVVKYGGAAMVQEDLKKSFSEDIVLLKYLGIHPVVVHGGGPEINQVLKKLEIPSQFVRGQRVTDEKTMEVVEMVLTGKVNKEIVSLISQAKGKAVGVSGKDGNLTIGKKILIDGEDIGQVGDIEKVDPSLIDNLIQNNFIPVISPISQDSHGMSLNVNADTMAGAIASAIGAEKLILLTDTPGILIEGNLVHQFSKSDIQKYISSGEINGGMIPKAECCLSAVEKGVKRAHIIDGRVPHSLLIEILTNHGIGSYIES